MNINIKNPPKGDCQSSWNFKPCRYKKVIIKKNQYRILPNGDIEIMAREDTIGFKTIKRKPRKPGKGGSGNSNGGQRTSKYVTKEDFNVLNKDFNDLKNILLEFIDSQGKFNQMILEKIDNLETKVDNLDKRVQS